MVSRRPLLVRRRGLPDFGINEIHNGLCRDRAGRLAGLLGARRGSLLRAASTAAGGSKLRQNIPVNRGVKGRSESTLAGRSGRPPNGAASRRNAT